MGGLISEFPETLAGHPAHGSNPILLQHQNLRHPYQRSDDFSGPSLKPVWQWNHNPDNTKWELNKKKGSLRLHTLPAKDFLWAKNTLTQRVIGPVSSATAVLDASALKPGDFAGLAIFKYALCMYWDRAK